MIKSSLVCVVAMLCFLGTSEADTPAMDLERSVQASADLLGTSAPFRATSPLISDRSMVDKMSTNEQFYSGSFGWIFSPPFGGDIIGLGYESSPFGARVTGVTGCLFNESAFSRVFEGLVAVVQGGVVVESTFFSRSFPSSVATCYTLSLTANLEPGEFAISIFFRYGDQDNLFAAIPATTNGSVFDVQINSSRPPTTSDGPVRGIGLEYSIDRFEGDTTPRITDSQALLLPGFSVDTTNSQGLTTFLAVRNTTSTSRNVLIEYFGSALTDEPLRTDVISLAPQQTHARDVRTNLADLEISGGLASGLILVREQGGDASALTGDFFRLDRANAFASGDRLVSPTDFCNDQEIRYVDFGSGTQLAILLNRVSSDGTTDIPYTAYDEAGAVVFEGVYATSKNLNFVDISELVPGVSFGTVVFDFSGTEGGLVSGRYEALGQFSVELNSACRS